MHVRHVVRQFAPMIGGLEDAVSQLAAHLQTEQNIDCSVLTLDRSFSGAFPRLPPSDVHLSIPVTRIPFSGSKRYPFAPTVLRHLGDADIVHVHGIDFFFDFLALTKIWHRRLLVASTHGGFFHTNFASRAKRVYFQSSTRVSARAYDRIFGSSESDTLMFEKIAPSQTVMIENGVNTDKWRAASSAIRLPVMLFIGRFSSNKNIPLLINLLSSLNSEWRLIIAGQPADLSVEDLCDEAARCGVSERCQVVVNADEAALRDIIGQASYVVSASRYEGFGISVIEGMSAGLTPILNRIAPFERLVSQSKCGIVVEMDNVGLAVRAIDDLHQEWSAEKRAANIAASQAYCWNRVAESFADHYRAVLAGKRLP